MHEPDLPALRVPLRPRGALAGAGRALEWLGAPEAFGMDLRRWFPARGSKRAAAPPPAACASPSTFATGGPDAAAGSERECERSILDLAPGEEARVARMNGGSARRLGRLSGYGLAPGTRMRLVQKRPVVVIEVGGTRLAFEAEVAAAIRVGGPLGEP